MNKLICLLALLFIVTMPFAQEDYDRTKYIAPTNVAQNVWDTNTVSTFINTSKSIRIECLSGSIIISLSQGTLDERDTTLSYDSIAAGQYFDITNTTAKTFFVKAIGGAAMFKASVYYGKSHGTRKGSIGSTPANLYGYAYKDSLNTFSMHQTMDSLTVTRLATIDSAAITNIYMPNGATSRLWFGTSDNIYGSSGDLWLNGSARINSSGVLVGDGVTGQPFLTKTGSVSNTQYGFFGDVNTGMYRIGADNLGLAVGGTKAVDISATNIGLMLPTAFVQMDETARDALTPAAGWVIWNTTSGRLQVFNGVIWEDLH